MYTNEELSRVLGELDTYGLRKFGQKFSNPMFPGTACLHQAAMADYEIDNRPYTRTGYSATTWFDLLGYRHKTPDVMLSALVESGLA